MKVCDLKSTEFFGQIVDVNGNIVEERYLGKNIIVESASVLIAQLISQQYSNDFVPGFTHLAIGTGDFDWDKFDPPQPMADVTQLKNELTRKMFEVVKYIKTDGSGADSTVPTNVVDFIAVFNESEGVGPLVEMGIFGGNGANLDGGGTMVNYKTFPVWSKPIGAKLRLVWRITT